MPLRVAANVASVPIMSESLTRLNHLLDDFDRRVQAVPSDAWCNQSPCAEWKAHDVVVHVSNNLARIGGIAPTNIAPTNTAPTNTGETISQAWSRTHKTFKANMAKADLSQVVEGPFGPMPLDDLIGRLICNDVLVHTWDLARATGGDEKLNADAVAGAYSGLKPLDAMIRQPGIFDAKIEAPAGADVQTQFLNFLGRKV
jgi:uncharacterized protein (TIGR03086 family)